MKTNLIWSLFVILVFSISVFFFIRNTTTDFSQENSETPQITQKAPSIEFVKIGGQNIKVDVALTPKEHSNGLSGRPSLRSDEGLLFIFDTPGKYSFWMRDMNFAIDMIWIGEDMGVVYIKKNATPESYPDAYQPGENAKNAKYVLEVVSGFSDKNNLKIGDQVLFTY